MKTNLISFTVKLFMNDKFRHILDLNLVFNSRPPLFMKQYIKTKNKEKTR